MLAEGEAACNFATHLQEVHVPVPQSAFAVHFCGAAGVLVALLSDTAFAVVGSTLL